MSAMDCYVDVEIPTAVTAARPDHLHLIQSEKRARFLTERGRSSPILPSDMLLSHVWSAIVEPLAGSVSHRSQAEQASLADDVLATGHAKKPQQ